MSTKALLIALGMILMAVGSAAASGERDEVQAPRGEPDEVQAPRGLIVEPSRA